MNRRRALIAPPPLVASLLLALSLFGSLVTNVRTSDVKSGLTDDELIQYRQQGVTVLELEPPPFYPNDIAPVDAPMDEYSVERRARYVPPGWTCEHDLYNASDGRCDCNCGVRDPDCDMIEPALFGCPNYHHYQCVGPDGHCEFDPTIPAEWLCTASKYNSGYYCNCGCGAWDPDCNNDIVRSYLTIGCPTLSHHTCESSGVCVHHPEIPAEWNCPAYFYGSNDGCDCYCNAWDPDCSGYYLEGLFGCPNQSHYLCAGPDGHCEVDTSVPSDWRCMALHYDSYDGCQCGCGDVDPDCGTFVTQPVYGCPNQTHYRCGGPDGHSCELDPSIPSGWTCMAHHYNAGDGCHCGCGVWDGDCDAAPPPEVFGCPDQTHYRCVGSDGHCELDPMIPSGWTCPAKDFGDGYACHCGCGGWDSDCDNPYAALFVGGCPLSGAERYPGIASHYTCEKVDEMPTCKFHPEIPEGWTCPAAWYSDYQCHCGCGVIDPTCFLDSPIVQGCPKDPDAVWSCDLSTAECVDLAIQVPSEWICEDEKYGAGDLGCNCNCGVLDFDCYDPQAKQTGCDPFFFCSLDRPDGSCQHANTPGSWTCPDYMYGSGLCSCGCGAWDPSCQASGVLNVGIDGSTPSEEGDFFGSSTDCSSLTGMGVCVEPGVCDRWGTSADWTRRSTIGILLRDDEWTVGMPVYPSGNHDNELQHPGGRNMAVITKSPLESEPGVGYLVGGGDSEGGYRGDVWKYEVAAQDPLEQGTKAKWSFVETNLGDSVQKTFDFCGRNVEEETVFPGGRAWHTVQSLPSDGRLRLYGGIGFPVSSTHFSCVSPKSHLQDIWDFDVVNKTWKFRSIEEGSESWTNKIGGEEDGYPGGGVAKGVWRVGNDLVECGGHQSVDVDRLFPSCNLLWRFRDDESRWETLHADCVGCPLGRMHPSLSVTTWEMEVSNYTEPLLFMFGGATLLTSSKRGIGGSNDIYMFNVSAVLWTWISRPVSRRAPKTMFEESRPGGRMMAFIALVESSDEMPFGGGVMYGGAGSPTLQSELLDTNLGGLLTDTWLVSIDPTRNYSVTWTAAVVPQGYHDDLLGTSVFDEVYHEKNLLYPAASLGSLFSIGRAVFYYGGLLEIDGKKQTSSAMWYLKLPCSDPELCRIYCADFVARDSEYVCGGHGTCDSDFGPCQCKKEEGWGGSFCRSPLCLDGLASDDPNTCSGHGSCPGPFEACECDDGFVLSPDKSECLLPRNPIWITYVAVSVSLVFLVCGILVVGICAACVIAVKTIRDHFVLRELNCERFQQCWRFAQEEIHLNRKKISGWSCSCSECQTRASSCFRRNPEEPRRVLDDALPPHCRFEFPGDHEGFGGSVGNHGTSIESAVKIAATGQLAHGDDRVPGGEIEPREGHFEGAGKAYLTPSLRYALLYSEEKEFEDQTFVVVFEFRITENTFDAIGDSFGLRDPFDPVIQNSRLEWETDFRSNMLMTALLVFRLDSEDQVQDLYDQYLLPMDEEETDPAQGIRRPQSLMRPGTGLEIVYVDEHGDVIPDGDFAQDDVQEEVVVYVDETGAEIDINVGEGEDFDFVDENDDDDDVEEVVLYVDENGVEIADVDGDFGEEFDVVYVEEIVEEEGD